MLVPWLGLLGLAAVGWRALPRIDGPDLPGPATGIGTLVEGAWPIVVAGGMLLAWRRIAGPITPGAHPRIPPGDAVVWIERGWIGFFGWWRRRGLPNPTRWAMNLVPLSDHLLDMLQQRSIIDRSERRIGTWGAAGIFFLLLALVFFIALN